MNNTKPYCPGDNVNRLILALYLEPGLKKSMLSRLIREYFDGLCHQRVFAEASAIITPETWERVAWELDECARHGYRLLSAFDDAYPSCLKEINEPPPVLYINGELPKEFSIGIVGARAASNYGERVAQSLGKQVVETGGVVISGLALGVDRYAHLGALNAIADNSTATPGVAVLGSGLRNVQPPSNRGLAERLQKAGGAIVSEYPLRMPGLPENFPRRNRIISALSDAVIVVEAKERSGALITARHAFEYARPVFAVPGAIDAVHSQGTNQLLYEGARIVRSIDDVLSAVPELRQFRKVNPSKRLRPSDRERTSRLFADLSTAGLAERILQILGEDGVQPFDRLVQRLEIHASELSGVLAALELNGLINSPAPNCFQRSLTT